MNVVIYTGPGAVTQAATQNLETLRRLLFPHYAVTTLNTEALLRQPWSGSCALLVFPEGYESEYTEALGAQGIAGIVTYVRNGGRFLALGNGVAAACGEGGLGFYNGIWKRESGDTREQTWQTVSAEGKIVRFKRTGEFMDTEGIDQNTTEIVRKFVQQDEDGASREGQIPAVLYSKVGDGAAVLASVELR
jgi:biotin--protein ligase